MRKLTVVVIASVGLLAFVVFAQSRSQTTLEQAQAIRVANMIKWDRWSSYGLDCFEPLDSCESLIARADTNPKLKEVLLQVKEAGLKVHPEPIGWFSIDRFGGLHVRTWLTSDEEIIAFLTN